MKIIKVKDKSFSLYITAEKIKEQIKKTAKKINTELKDKQPLFLVILNGSFIFAADLLREITIPCEINFIRVASYNGTNSTGNVKKLIGLNENIKGRTVVIVEDIIDTGITMQEILQMLAKENPEHIYISSLLVKPQKLKINLDIHYRCFNIENDFIVGYGLDYNQEGRNLPEIYKIIE